MKVQPLGERVLVKVSEAETKTSSGLYIPQSAQEKTQIGEIVAIGDVKTLKVGTKVMYDKYAGTSFKDAGADFLILKLEDVIAIIE